MMKRSYMSYYYFFFKPRRRKFSSCPIPIDPPPSTPSSTTPTRNDHSTLFLSLIDNLVTRGSISYAQRLIRRMIAQSGTVADAILAADVATLRGFDLDLGNYGFLIKKLLNFGEHALAEVIYCRNVVGRGLKPDTGLLNSMVVCYCNLGRLEEAKAHFDRIIYEKGLEPHACNVFIRKLCAYDRNLEAYNYLFAVTGVGIDLRYWCYDKLVVSLSARGYLNEASDVFYRMLERTGSRPSVHLYKTLVYGLCKRGLAEEAELMCYDMEAQGFFIDKTMYTSLINGYCKSSKMNMAMRIFFRMLKMGCEPDSYTYNTLMHGFGLEGQYNKGMILYNRMVDLGVKPSMVTYHVLISRYCKEQNVNSALALLNGLLGQNLVLPVHCYTVVIDSLYKDKDDRSADIEELYTKMVDNGIVPDHVLFFTFMKYCLQGSELQYALVILEAIGMNGCEIGLCLSLDSTDDLKKNIELLVDEIAKFDLKLGNVAFSIFITSLCAIGEIDDALSCLHKMANLGCRPFLSTYNSLIKCLIREGHIDDDAVSHIQVMQDLGLVPDLATYLIMINEHCKRGDLGPAFDIFDQMNESEIRPSVAIFDSIIGCLSRRKRMYEAGRVFQRMLDVGVKPDEIIYTNMINGYSKSGRAYEAIRMFDKMEGNGFKPSARAYTALIYGLVKKNMTHKGCLYLERMLKDDIVPNTVLYTSLINQFLRKGEFQIALSLVKLMEKNKVEHDLIAYITLVSGFCSCIIFLQRRHPIANRNSRRGVKQLFHLLQLNSLPPKENILEISDNTPKKIKSYVSELVNKVKESSFMPNLHIYTSMISGYCRAGRIEDAYDHFESMIKSGLHPNQVTLTILMNGYFRVGDADTAVEIFKLMVNYGSPPDKIAYNALVRGLCKSGRLQDALSYSHAMHKRGLTPNKASYEFLLNKLCGNYLGSQAFSIFEEMIAHRFVPCRYNYNFLLRILCEENKVLEACVVVDMMRKRGKFPDENTRRLLLDTYNTKRKVEYGLHE